MRRGVLSALWTAFALLQVASAFAQSQVPLWTRFEASFESQRAYDNPLQQVELQATFVSPSGKKQTVLGFWDGGKTWRARFSPEEVGEWKYTTAAGDPADKGLDGQSGKFACVAYAGDNPLYRRGAIRLAPDRFHLMRADGTPFFWLADTAWNGALKAADADWKTYLADRRSKRFTAVQFVVTQWRAGPTDREGQVAYTGLEKIAVQPAFFQRMDRYFDALNEAGLVGLPVLLWAIKGDINPGWSLPEDQAARLVRYMVARYGAHQVIWILGGDGNYTSDEAARRWAMIGREGLKFNPGRLTTIHCGGMQWPWDKFRDQAWLDVLIYQSGHGNSDASRRWNCVGPPATKWRDQPHRPILNSEPNYEGHMSYQDRKPFSDYEVRRAAYWSVLATPTAGLTYGVHGVWSWEEKPGVPLAHNGTGEARPWHEAMKFPGSDQMKIMRDFFDRLPWWELRPADEIVVDRPDDPTFLHYAKAAKTESGEWAVVYLPDNDGVWIDAKAFGGPMEGVCFDPRTGKFSQTLDAPPDSQKHLFKAPGPGDWLLVLHKKK